MLLSFLTILQKCVLLFLMMIVGYICGKKEIITNEGAKQITSILLYISAPCITVSSLQSIIGKVSMKSLLVYAGLAIVSFGISVLLSFPFFRKSPLERRKVLRFSVVYSNCGFMGIPLAEAILGSTGVVYAAIHCAVFYLYIWSHGVILMSGEKHIKVKKLLVNPGTIGLAIGFPLFALSLKLPELIETPIENFSSLNTPLAMIVIGSYISRVKLKELIADIDLYKLSAIKLLLVPAAVLAVLLPFGFDKTAASAILLLTAAPTAGNAAMFAAEFGAETELGSKAVALTSILSILTLPVFSVLAQQLL